MTGFDLLLDGPKHLANAVNTDGKNQEIHAMKKAGQIQKDKARFAGDDVHPNGRQRQTDAD
ncbi:hypothetical protein MnTg02_00190 [bacterium MnTg02]|nr:hypothetical protein MnTg02_00190 [bacterium MnTg02]